MTISVSIDSANATVMPVFDGKLYMGTDQGAPFGGSSPFSGYLDDVRVTRGLARWSAGFTPPAVPVTCTP